MPIERGVEKKPRDVGAWRWRVACLRGGAATTCTVAPVPEVQVERPPPPQAAAERHTHTRHRPSPPAETRCQNLSSLSPHPLNQLANLNIHSTSVKTDESSLHLGECPRICNQHLLETLNSKQNSQILAWSLTMRCGGHQLQWVNEGLNKLPMASGRMDQQKKVGFSGEM